MNRSTPRQRSVGPPRDSPQLFARRPEALREVGAQRERESVGFSAACQRLGAAGCEHRRQVGGVIDEPNKAELVELAPEGELMVVDRLAEPTQARNDDRPTAAADGQENRADPRVRDDRARTVHRGDEFRVRKERDHLRPLERARRVTTLHENVLVTRLGHRVRNCDETVERLARSDREDDHGAEKTMPSNRAPGT